MPENRKLYQGLYRTELEADITTQSDEPTTQDADNSTTSDDGLSPEQRSWKKRYGDLRTHNNSLTERNKQLEAQLQAAQKKDIKIPSSKEELTDFAAKYPDVYRHIRSIAMAELLQERENITQETNIVKADLEKLQMERGYAKILQAHPDCEAIRMSEEFHEWANRQPTQIQDWLFASSDADLCIKGLDLYKAETNFKKQAPRKNGGVDTLVNTKSSVEVPQEGNKRIWKGSEILKLHPKQYEKLESEIERARSEGRVDMYA